MNISCNHFYKLTNIRVFKDFEVFSLKNYLVLWRFRDKYIFNLTLFDTVDSINLTL